MWMFNIKVEESIAVIKGEPIILTKFASIFYEKKFCQHWGTSSFLSAIQKQEKDKI